MQKPIELIRQQKQMFVNVHKACSGYYSTDFKTQVKYKQS